MLNGFPNFPSPEDNQQVIQQNQFTTPNQPVTQLPITQQTVDNNNQNTNIGNSIQTENTTQTEKKYPPKYTFYTGSSALSISFNDKAIFWETAPALGQKSYDWQNNKVTLKMGVEEIDQILLCLNAFMSGGIQMFQQMAQFLQPNNKQPGSLYFFHDSGKAKTGISIFIGKNGIPGISVNKTESTGTNKSVYFPILPSQIMTFIRVHDVYASEALKFPVTVNNTNKSIQNGGNQQ